MLKIKWVYDGAVPADGKRLLVDRLWPRGLGKEVAGVNEWIKEIAPSDALRKWFGHEPDKWEEFRRRYIQELATPEKQAELRRIAEMARRDTVTLVYAAKDTEHNNAVLLAGCISDLMKGN